MVTERQITTVAHARGFTAHECPGFVGFHRTHPDGRHQQLHFFWWQRGKSNPDQDSLRAFLVVCPAPSASEPYSEALEDGTNRCSHLHRLSIPLVVWPSVEQPLRKWPDVVAEFDEIIMPIMDAGPDEAAALYASLSADRGV